MAHLQRFSVNFDTHEIMTKNEDQTEQITKVEPRMIMVLKLLMEHSPQVVTRETLIETVWNNYGGADDALNQAISHLRKTLNDHDKDNRIIETVVKKGYRLDAKYLTSTSESQKTTAFYKNKLIWAALLVVASSGLYYVMNRSSEVALAPTAPTSQATESEQSPPTADQ